jgi:hypothetical protein
MKRTSKVRKRPQSQALQVRVITPRIAWVRFLRLLGRLTKFALVLAALAAVGIGIQRGVEHVVYQNPDFQLGFIDLNPNTAFDEAEVVKIAGIPLHANLFDLDVEKITNTLSSRPEIISAAVERHLPDTLRIRIVERTPAAWIACPEETLPATRELGALLVDAHGVAYPCPQPQLETASTLPIILLPSLPAQPIHAGAAPPHPELKRCLRLIATAAKLDPLYVRNIDSIRQENAWSLTVTTRDQTVATFGLGDHDRQINDLRVALDHARTRNYEIASINLIPKKNIPVTPRSEASYPRAIPVPEPSQEEIREDRRSRDLDTLLNRR